MSAEIYEILNDYADRLWERKDRLIALWECFGKIERIASKENNDLEHDGKPKEAGFYRIMQLSAKATKEQLQHTLREEYPGELEDFKKQRKKYQKELEEFYNWKDGE